MKKIAFHNIKGGCGKTTLISYLSIAMYYRNISAVTLYDLDLLQSSLLQFMKTRNSNRLPHPAISSNMQKAIKDVDGDNENMVLYDLAGGIEKGYRNILEKVDQIIVPVTFSPHTIASTREYLDSIDELGLLQKCKVVCNAIRDEEQLKSLQNLFPNHLHAYFKRRVGYENEQVLSGVTDIDRFYGRDDSGEIQRQSSHYRIVREYDRLLTELGLLDPS